MTFAIWIFLSENCCKFLIFSIWQLNPPQAHKSAFPKAPLHRSDWILHAYRPSHSAMDSQFRTRPYSGHWASSCIRAFVLRTGKALWGQNWEPQSYQNQKYKVELRRYSERLYIQHLNLWEQTWMQKEGICAIWDISLKLQKLDFLVLHRMKLSDCIKLSPIGNPNEVSSSNYRGFPRIIYSALLWPCKCMACLWSIWAKDLCQRMHQLASTRSHFRHSSRRLILTRGFEASAHRVCMRPLIPFDSIIKA